jgi:hypothetical protein
MEDLIHGKAAALSTLQAELVEVKREAACKAGYAAAMNIGAVTGTVNAGSGPASCGAGENRLSFVFEE